MFCIIPSIKLRTESLVEKENVAGIEVLENTIILCKWNCSYPFNETIAIDLK